MPRALHRGLTHSVSPLFYARSMVFKPYPTHLIDGAVNDDGMTTPRALCGTWNPRRWTHEADATTCTNCRDAMLLSPA